MDKERLVVYVVVACVVIAALFSILSYDSLRSGKHLAASRPQLIISADCPWASLPPAIKEYISLNATNLTYLDKADMLQLSEYYKDLAKNYKEQIALINTKDFPQPKKEVVK